MENLSISDDEFDKYIQCIDNKKNEISIQSKSLGNTIINNNTFNRYEKINPEVNLIYEENNNINFVNYFFNSLKNKKKNNHSNEKETETQEEKKKTRTSKFKINEMLSKYYENDKTKWNRNKINQISKETNLSPITILKWNIKEVSKIN